MPGTRSKRRGQKPMKPNSKTTTVRVTNHNAARAMSDPAEELAFLSSENVLSYAGEWVAIADARVTAHGPSLMEVQRKALTKMKGRKPTYFAVPAGAATY